MSNPKYPYTVLAYEFETIKNGDPYPIKCRLEKPIEPTLMEFKESSFYGWMTGAAVISVIVLIFQISKTINGTSYKDDNFTYLFSIVIIIIFLIMTNTNSQEKGEIDQKNGKILSNYQKRKVEYEKAHNEFIELQNIKNDLELDYLYRQNKLKTFFNEVSKAEISLKTKRGKNELHFI